MNGVGALLVAANFDEVFFDQVQNAHPLLNRAIRKKLLKEVVAILVAHDGRELFTDLCKQKFNKIWVGLGQLTVL